MVTNVNLFTILFIEGQMTPMKPLKIMLEYMKTNMQKKDKSNTKTF